MKNPRFLCLLAAIALLPMTGARCADMRPAQAATAAAAQHKDAAPSAKPPAGVDIYANTVVGAGQTCEVGAKSDQDGLNERPVVYLAKAAGGYAWHVQLHIPKDMYQGRATHCTASADALYVLVQIDTQSEQSTSQTVLQVVQLNTKTGAVMALRPIEVPGAGGAYSAWVDDGADHFKFEGGKLVIKGSYELLSERDNPSGKEPPGFTVAISADLHP